MKTIGILGGSFNPVTIGHIKLCEYVLQHHHLDEVWLMPCYGHRFKSYNVSSQDRLEMCKIAVKNHERIKVSDFEIAHQLDGSTYETSILLDEHYPQFKFEFIIGMDNANSIDSWKEAEYLKKYVPFIVVSRQGIKEQNNKWYNSNVPAICKSCQGHKVELCENPDHGLYDACSGLKWDATRIGCPGCGHDIYKRTKRICQSCNGSGEIKAIHTFLCAGNEIPETSSTECRDILNKYNDNNGSLRLNELLFSEVKDYILKWGLYVYK